MRLYSRKKDKEKGGSGIQKTINPLLQYKEILQSTEGEKIWNADLARKTLSRNTAKRATAEKPPSRPSLNELFGPLVSSSPSPSPSPSPTTPFDSAPTTLPERSSSPPAPAEAMTHHSPIASVSAPPALPAEDVPRSVHVPSLFMPSNEFSIRRLGKLTNNTGSESLIPAGRADSVMKSASSDQPITRKNSRYGVTVPPELQKLFDERPKSSSMPYSNKKLRRTASESFYYSWETMNVSTKKDEKEAGGEDVMTSPLQQSASIMMGMPVTASGSSSHILDSKPTPRRASDFEAAPQLPEMDPQGELIEKITVDGKTIVVSGTLPQLILNLYDPSDIHHHDYVSVFLATFRYFIESTTLLSNLIDRFFQEEEEKTWQKIRRFRIVAVLRRWVETPFYGFALIPELNNTLQEFIERASNTPGVEKEWLVQLQKAQIAGAGEVPIDWTNVPKPLLPSSLSNLVFTDIPPLELARQMTLIESRMFQSIKCVELFHCAWSKEDREVRSPHVIAMASHFNRVSYWVASEIVSTSHPTQRVETLRRFIQLAEHLITLNNFNGAMQIFASLNMGPIQRLKSTWKEVPEKSRKKLAEIEKLFASTGNYRNYREVLRQSTPPVVPFQAVLLGDLTQCDEIPNILGTGRINFEKMNTVAKVLKEVETAQSVPYALADVPAIQEFLLHTHPMTEALLYRLAKECEEAASLKSLGRARGSSFYGTLGRRTMRDDIRAARAMMDEDEEASSYSHSGYSSSAAMSSLSSPPSTTSESSPSPSSAAVVASKSALPSSSHSEKLERKKGSALKRRDGSRRGSILDRFSSSSYNSSNDGS